MQAYVCLLSAVPRNQRQRMHPPCLALSASVPKFLCDIFYIQIRECHQTPDPHPGCPKPCLSFSLTPQVRPIPNHTPPTPHVLSLLLLDQLPSPAPSKRCAACDMSSARPTKSTTRAAHVRLPPCVSQSQHPQCHALELHTRNRSTRGLPIPSLRLIPPSSHS